MLYRHIIIYIITTAVFTANLSFAADSTFIVIGDSRSGDFNRNYFLTREIIEDAVSYTSSKYGNLAGIIMTGDFVNSGEDEDEWNNWITANEKALNYPVYPCIGNHDDEHLNCSNLYYPDNTGELPCYLMQYYTTSYYKSFQVLEWYSADINNLHIISISSNFEVYNPGAQEGYIQESIQWSWLREDLMINDNEWTIAIWHKPAFGSHTFFGKGHGSDMFMRDRYVSVLEQYGCDLVFSGHNHWYERTSPILNNEENDNGIIHVTTGGGGAPLLPVSFFPFDKVHSGSGKILSDVNTARYHFCILTVKDDLLKVQAVQYHTHEILDEFEVTNR